MQAVRKDLGRKTLKQLAELFGGDKEFPVRWKVHRGWSRLIITLNGKKEKTKC